MSSSRPSSSAAATARSSARSTAHHVSEMRNARVYELEAEQWMKQKASENSKTWQQLSEDQTAASKEATAATLRKLLELSNELDATAWMFDPRYS